MPEIFLTTPSKAHEAAALEYIDEHRRLGEVHSHGAGGLFRAASYDAWLDILARRLDLEHGSGDRVPASTFFALDTTGRIVGMVNIRHRLTPYLLQVDGNIGFGVRPTERGKGIATAILREALAFCKSLGMERALVTCNDDNPASAQVIRKNGGVFEDTFLEDNGRTVERYWIALPQAGKE